jgi:hypothetical protein
MSLIKKAIVFLFFAAVTGSQFVDTRVVQRYRITITIQTPEGLRSGASVIEARYDDSKKGGSFPHIVPSHVTTGEAIYVDLGTGPDGKPRHVIGLLASGARANDVDWHRSMPWAPFKAAGNPKALEERATLTGMAEIPPGPVKLGSSDTHHLLPTLITFTDVSDPASARVLFGTDYRTECREDRKPHCVPRYIPVPVDTFEATFGPGHGFHKATIEILAGGSWPFNLFRSNAPEWLPESLTGTPITRGIEARLPGLKDLVAWNNRATKRKLPSDQYGGGSGTLIRNW